MRLVVFRQCDLCANMTENPFWCTECFSMAYCSKRCRDKHWNKIHGRECCRREKDGSAPETVVHPCSVCKVHEDDELDGTSGQCRTCGVLVCRRCTEGELPTKCPKCDTTYNITKEEAAINMIKLLTDVELKPEAERPPERFQKYAHNFMAGAMLSGGGIMQDTQKAGVAFLRACELGHAPSLFTTAKALLDTGHKENGLQFMESAAEKGYAPAVIYAYTLYRERDPATHPFTRDKLRDYLTRDSCHRNPTAMYCLGMLLEDDQPTKQLPFASIISLYGAGASMGSQKCKARMEQLEDEALAYGDGLLRRFAVHWKQRQLSAPVKE